MDVVRDRNARIRSTAFLVALGLWSCTGSVVEPPTGSGGTSSGGGSSDTPSGSSGNPGTSGGGRSNAGGVSGEASATGGSPSKNEGGAGPTACASTESDGAPVPMRRLTATQVERSVADVLGVKVALNVSDEKLFTYRSNISSSVDSASARGYFDFATAAVAAADLERCNTTCLDWLVDEVGLRLFRRPLDDTQRANFSDLFALGSQNGGVRAGAEWVLEAMLQSPSFLYADDVAKTDGTLDDYSIGSRLSLLLWGSNPDLELLHRAEHGELSSPDAIGKEVKRLLAAPQSEEGLREFVDQWLELARLEDPDTRPDVAELGADTVAALREEPVKFFQALLRSGAGISDLLTSVETAASPKLDAIYGEDIVARSSDAFTLDPRHRGGILTLPGVVAALSHAKRTSPTLRGKAVLTSLLCTPPAPPPAGVDVTLPAVGADVTTRERLEIHMTDPSCGSCHRGMDGIGFALEKLDWLGRSRNEENGRAIEDESTFPLGGVEVTVTGAAALGRTLSENRNVAACLSKQWVRYSLGVAESSQVACLIERLTSEVRGARGLENMIVTTLTSDWFRRAPGDLQ